MASIRALQAKAREISLGPFPGGLLAARFAAGFSLIGGGIFTLVINQV